VKLGASGERAAARVLRRAGYRILARNYTCPAGEIDLIAADADTIVFVEVKTRTSTAINYPEASVTWAKRKQLTRVARYFLQAKSAQDRPSRFDVVAVVMPDGGKPEAEHFVNAFEPLYG
jgi:putative endonuclease